MNAGSREPQSCSMACLTVADVVKGPGVSSHGSGRGSCMRCLLQTGAHVLERPFQLLLRLEVLRARLVELTLQLLHLALRLLGALHRLDRLVGVRIDVGQHAGHRLLQHLVLAIGELGGVHLALDLLALLLLALHLELRPVGLRLRGAVQLVLGRERLLQRVDRVGVRLQSLRDLVESPLELVADAVEFLESNELRDDVFHAYPCVHTVDQFLIP